MTSDVMFESDRKQSVSAADVKGIEQANAEHALEPWFTPATVPVAGVSCRIEKHGRMLMSAKTGLLECGVCGFSGVAPKE